MSATTKLISAKDTVKVALLKDQFWNNNSEAYPTSAPSPSLYSETNKVPIIHSPYIGTVILDGEFNAAMYCGKYYQLRKIRVQDTDGVYKYQMEYDVMMNFLSQTGTIRGTVIRTNNFEWIEENLQTCKPILEDPCSITYVNFNLKKKLNEEGFEEKPFNWQTDCKLVLPEELPDNIRHQEAVSKQSWERFLKQLETNKWIKLIKAKKWRQLQDDIYITSFLNTVRIPSWKLNVLEKIKEAVKNFKDYVISQADQLEDSSLKTLYTITPKVGGISRTVSTDTTNIFTKIDLSKLTDIVPISQDGARTIPYHNVSLDDLVDEVARDIPLPDNWIRKIARNPHLPIKNFKNDIEDNAYLPVPREYYSLNTDELGYKGQRPQKITFLDGKTDSKFGYLWYMDKLEFAMVGKDRQFPTNIDGGWFFMKLSSRKAPNIGWLIYQHKDNDFFEGIRYTAQSNMTKYVYRSGINNKLLTYGDFEKSWYKSKNPRLRAINGTKELSALTLETDLFLWLAFAPVPNDYDYGYHYKDHYGIRDILINNGYGSPGWWTTTWMNADIGKAKIANPFQSDRIDAWKNKKKQKIDEISIFSEIDLKIPVKTNDIFTTSLTHKISGRGIDMGQSIPAEWGHFTTDSPVYDNISYYGASIFRPHMALLKGLDLAQYYLNNSSSSNEHNIVSISDLQKIQRNPILVEKTATPTQKFFSTIFNHNGIVDPLNFTLSGVVQSAKSNNNEERIRQMLNTLYLKDIFMESSENPTYLNNKVVVYIDNSVIRFGSYHQYTRNLELSTNPEQIIEFVEGKTSEEITFYHINSINIDIDPSIALEQAQKTVQDAIIRRAFALTHEGDDQGIYNFTKKKLESETRQLFDLEGTDWYCWIDNGKCSLISKKSVDRMEKIPQYDSVEWGNLRYVSIYEKLNQKNFLSIFGTTKQLNTKFNFDGDPFNLIRSKITDTTTNSSVDYWHIKSENDHDVFDEVIEVVKKELPASKSINMSELDALRTRIRHENQNFQIEKWAQEHQYNTKMRKFQRDKDDLWYQLLSHGLGLIGSGMEAAALTAIPGAIAKKKLFSIFKGSDATTEYGLAKQALMTGKYGRGLSVVTAGRTLSSIPFFLQYSSLQNRINEDERDFMTQNSIDAFTRNTKFSQNYELLVNELNTYSNSYIRAETNNANIIESLKKTAGLDYIHIQVFLPTGGQLSRIQAITDLYGVECFIQDKEIHVRNGMRPQTIQFAPLFSDSIESDLLNDLTLREMVKGLFEKGIIFLDHHHTAEQPRDIEIYFPSDEEFVYNVEDINKWSSEEWNRYKITVAPDQLDKVLSKLSNYGLTREEYEKHKEEINPEHPSNAVNQIIGARDTGIKVIIKPLESDKQKIKELEEKLEELEKKHSDLDESKTNCDNKLAELEQKKTDLEGELRQCNINLKNIQQAKETCDRINAAEQKKLKTEIGKLKQQIAEKTREKEDLDSLKQDLEGQISELNTQLDQTKKNLEDKTKEFTLEKENLNNLKQDLERQLAECLAKPKATPEELQAVKDQLDAEKRKSEDCRNQITNLTNRLKTAEEKAKNAAPSMPNECELLHQMIVVPYEIDIKKNSQGSKAEQLCEQLAHQMEEIERNAVAIDTRKYPDVAKALDVLEELDTVKAINIFRDAMNMSGWAKYKQFKKTGGGKDSEVDEVIGLVNEVKDNLEIVHMHGLKVVLDELVYRLYKAKETHSVKNKTDPDNSHRQVSDIDLNTNLQFLFGSFVDSWKGLYKELFGVDIDLAVKKKIFENTPCVTDGGIRTIIYIDNLSKQITYNTSDLPVWEAPPEAHFISLNSSKYDELINPKNLIFEFFSAKDEKSGYDVGRFFVDSPYSGIKWIFGISDLASNYQRYWSKQASSGTKYFSWMNIWIFWPRVEYPLSSTSGKRVETLERISNGIYLHWAGKLTPDEFFKKRIENWKKIIQAFHNALSHEDLRDQIKREKKLDIQFRIFYIDNPTVRGSNKFRLKKTNRTYDIVKNFGVKDAYKALWILTVLNENGLYMNKIWQGNDGWKYRIQPMTNPFHEITTQEVIDNMTKAAKRSKNLDLTIDFVMYNNLVCIVSALLKNDYSVLEMPKTLEFLKKLNNVGYYDWSVSKDADPNDWDFD